MLVSSRKKVALTLAGLLVALLVVPGCGCSDDSIFTIPPLVRATQAARAQVGMELERTPAGGPLKIDVMFLLDDGLSMTGRDRPAPGEPAPGEILGDANRRIKTDVAQQIAVHVVAQLNDKLIADGVIADASEADLAFGVSRFEDYANFQRGDGRSAVDGLSRPFILNQPILRQADSAFLTQFSFALSLVTAFNPDGGTPGEGGADPFDAESALEALYQLATGAGYDGDGNGSTADSGGVGLLDTMLAPGTSGDVPAFEATLIPPTNSGDPPRYTVGGTNASGDLGGAGWRPGSIRFIVLVSDRCTVAPLDLSDSNLMVDAATNTIVGPISNTPSPSGAGPRESETIENVQSFACLTVSNTAQALDTQAVERYGWSDDLRVAPSNAATLQQAIVALNEMNIEVLNIGIGAFIAPTPNKPNLPAPSGPGEYPAIDNPNAPANPARTPYTFMSAISILTGARDTNQDGEGTPDPRWYAGLPLVYKLDFLCPSAGVFTNDVEADLSDRVAEWKPYAATGGTGSVWYVVTFDLTNSNPDLTITGLAPLVPVPDPGGSDPFYVVQNGNQQIVRVPCYDPTSTSTPPEPIRVAWTVLLERTDPESTNGLLSIMPANITAILADPADIPGVTENPTCGGIPPAVAPTSGSVTFVLPAIPDPENPPIGYSTLTAVSSGGFLFRDLERGEPAGTSIDTMAGPLDAGDVPYPTPP